MEPVSAARGQMFGAFLLTPQARAIGVSCAIVLFAVSTTVTLRQHPWDNPYAAPKGLSWFLYPKNPPTGLATVDADLHAVWALPDNRHVWAGGEVRTLVYSEDGGTRWAKLTAPAPNAAQPPPSANAPNPVQVTPRGRVASDSGGSGSDVRGSGSSNSNSNPSVSLLPPSAKVLNPDVAAGTTARLQIQTVNFKIDGKAPVTPGNPGFIKVESPEQVNDNFIIVPVTVLSATPPGAYTVQLHGSTVPRYAASPVESITLVAVFTVVAETSPSVPNANPNAPSSAPTQLRTVPQVEKRPPSFWHLPVVHAAAPLQPAAPGNTPGRSDHRRAF